jgi:hypothetical protein
VGQLYTPSAASLYPALVTATMAGFLSPAFRSGCLGLKGLFGLNCESIGHVCFVSVSNGQSQIFASLPLHGGDLNSPITRATVRALNIALLHVG